LDSKSDKIKCLNENKQNKKTAIARGRNESFPIQIALLERSNPLAFQEIASAKNASQ